MPEFMAPIPGSSLTAEPGNRPYETPPDITDPEDALLMHLENLKRPEAQKDIVDALDYGLDLQALTEGILRGGVANGKRSIDVSLVIAPIIHEYIKGTADAAGDPLSDEHLVALTGQITAHHRPLHAAVRMAHPD